MVPFSREKVSQGQTFGKIMENGAFYNLACEKGGVYPYMMENDWPKCVPESSKKRKKRFIVYPGTKKVQLAKIQKKNAI